MMHAMKRVFKTVSALLLCAVMIMLSSCRIVINAGAGKSSAEAQSSVPDTEAGEAGSAEAGEWSEDGSDAPSVPDESGEEEIDPYFLTSYKKAFGDKNLPDGCVRPGSVVFLHDDGEVEVVPWEDVDSFEQSGAGIPRTHYYDGEFPPEVRETLIPALDYSLAHGCFCFSIALIDVTYDKISLITDLLSKIFGISEKEYYRVLRINGRSIEYGRSIDIYLISSNMYKGRVINTWRVDLLKANSTVQDGHEKFRRALEAAGEIVNGMPEGLDEYGKALYLYKYVTENVSYVPDENEYMNSPDGVSPLYDALIKKSCVCTGYAEAIYCLFNLAGIDCIKTASAVGKDGRAEGAHMWNVARIDGDYYHFDATWDASGNNGKTEYFGLSTETMIKDHYRIPDGLWDKSIPECTKTLSEARGA